MITHPLGKNIGPPKSDKKYYQILILLFHFYKILGWLNAHIFKEKNPFVIFIQGSKVTGEIPDMSHYLDPKKR